MPEKTRMDLLREIAALSAKIRAQDRQLARFKKASPRLRSSQKNPEKTRSAALRLGTLSGLRGWLGNVISALLPTRWGLIELDAEGRIGATVGPLAEALARSQAGMIGMPWEHWIHASDRLRWRKYIVGLSKTHIVDCVSFRVCEDAGRPEWGGVAARLPGAEKGIWVLLHEPAVAGPDSPVAKHWAGIFAHELNQPLAAVLSTAQACRGLLASGELSAAELADALDGLIRRTRFAADVVRRLRTMAGGESLRLASAHLPDVVRCALDVLHDPLESSGVTIALDFAPDLPAVMIDAVQVVQVIVNLIRNAIEATNSLKAPRRRVTVRASRDGREVVLAVADQGVGLSVDVIRRLFEPLASTKSTGMGLGLAYSRQIVEAHGGRIWATANSPNGCVFFISFPLDPEES